MELDKTKEKLRQEGTPILGLRQDADEELKLVKVKLRKTDKNSVPDPFLLAVKAAVNWSSRCDMKLLPGCGDESLCDSCSESEEMPRTKPVVPPKSLVICRTDPELSDFQEEY